LLCHVVFVKCGQGSTDDELNPTCVSSLLGIQIESVAVGLWHTICISADGDVYAFGGNQFGQLGTGADQAEVYSFVVSFIKIVRQ
jgi:alpha-tubulin suppressor-like RCC1 family protein